MFQHLFYIHLVSCLEHSGKCDFFCQILTYISLTRVFMWYSKCQLSESRVPAAPLIVMQPQTQNVRALMYSEITPLTPPLVQVN